MGGVGAKDRRRVQRQSRPELEATRTSPTHRTNIRHVSRSTAATAVPTPAKKAVSMKPKHLKRKLEAASSAAEGLVVPSNSSASNYYELDERSALLQQLEKWQSAKASYVLERTRSRTERRGPKAAKKARKEEDVDNVGTKGSFVREIKDTAASKVAFREGEAVRDGARVARIHPTHRPRPNGAAKPHDGAGSGSHGVQRPKRCQVSSKDPLRGRESSQIRRQGVVEPPHTAMVADRGDSEDDDDDPNDDGSMAQKRQRGQRRRRGKKNTEVNPSHDDDEEEEADKEPVVDGPKETRPESDTPNQGTREESPSILDMDETISSTNNNKKKRNKNDDNSRDRYCVGRKPVTDFRVGQSYPGTVVYVKPFGVFVDIGCHSDAFCHVSRLADDYVDDPATAFRPGDAVHSARVVEIDRKRKRITVSFQSEAKIAEERQSIEARQERLKKRPRKERDVPSSRTKSLENMEARRGPEAGESEVVARSSKPPERAPASTPTNPSERVSSASQPPTTDSTLTPQQQLKRARKLERRAARRAAENDNVTP